MIEVKLDQGQLVELAEMIATKLRAPSAMTGTKPLTVEEAAQALGVSQRTIVRRVAGGEIPTVPGLGRTLIPTHAILELLDGKRPTKNRNDGQ